MRKLKLLACKLALIAAITGCSSAPSVPTQCPPKPVIAAWILEPEPSLIPKLDRIIWMSESQPNDSTSSSQPVKPPSKN